MAYEGEGFLMSLRHFSEISMTKLLVLSGPPGSGKDTLARFIEALGEARCFRLADPLYDCLYAVCGGFVNKDNVNRIKREKYPVVADFDVREFLIDISENYFKPSYGKDFFASITCDRINSESPRLAVVIDCGFEEEVRCFVDVFGVDNVSLLRLSRDGCDYLLSNDSRSVVGSFIKGLEIIEHYNTTREELFFLALRLCERYGVLR